jgi:hypothetical protein
MLPKKMKWGWRTEVSTLEAYNINYRKKGRKRKSEEAVIELPRIGRALNWEATDNCDGIKTVPGSIPASSE